MACGLISAPPGTQRTRPADPCRRPEQNATSDAFLAGVRALHSPLPFELSSSCEVIRREAHALIDGKPAADDPYLRLVHARGWR